MIGWTKNQGREVHNQNNQKQEQANKQTEKRSNEVVGGVLKRKYKGTGKVINKEQESEAMERARKALEEVKVLKKKSDETKCGSCG